jgi:hypothetical protein
VSPTIELTAASEHRAAENTTPIPAITRRTPKRSSILPMNGIASAPVSVPMRYAVEIGDRLIPSSSIIGSMNTDTAAVWPGAVAATIRVDQPTMCQP